jgi:DNA-directed RNA polymerase subunit beta'
MLKDFKALKLMLASPDQILDWSHGEVTKAETINYRTQKAEPQGLMCERIFGPAKNFECYCGKYKKMRYKGIVCDKCGVELTHKRVRRERMGHIELASPVTHIWYAHGTPNKLSLLLDIPQGKLESVIYFSRHLITEVNQEKKEKAISQVDKIIQDKIQEIAKIRDAEISEITKELSSKIKPGNELGNIKKETEIKQKVAVIRQQFKQNEEEIVNNFQRITSLFDNIVVGEVIAEDDLSIVEAEGLKFFKTEIGAEAIKTMLIKLSENIDEVLLSLEKRKESAKSVTVLKRIVDRYRMLRALKEAEINPVWMILDRVPVLPPDLRPIVQLPGGRYATSDLNDLYRRVINRNNRLKKLIDLGAPNLILRNEKRMLQEAVDVLYDNSHRTGVPVLNTRSQPYKSLSDMLRGKTGRFRQNLLGKRVDYSGRAVIVGGPELKVYECGLPQNMALELFRPYIVHEIIEKGYASNTKSAKTFFEEKNPEVFDILEKVIQNRPVLLNRAPTLHKQGILAFFPVLTDGNAIRLNPLVTTGFAADFDGDQMAVHVPLSTKAQKEAIAKMMADSNVLLMRDGTPVISASKDMVVGCFYLTRINEVDEKDGIDAYSDVDIVMQKLALGELRHDTPLKVMIDGEIISTTAGRIVFNKILPQGYQFVNKQVDKGSISAIVADVFIKYGAKQSLDVLDKVKELGFKYLTKSGMSIAISDYLMSPNRDKIMAEANSKENQLNDLLDQGLIAESEKPKLSQKIWQETSDKLAVETFALYSERNPLIVLDKSGGVPSKDPLKSSSSMKGLIMDLNGKVIELPLRSNYVIGFNSFEFFVSSRGTRKGEVDKALKTSKSGYLTRKLCDVGQSQITRIVDCGTTSGVILSRAQARRLNFEKRILGRFSVDDIVNPITKDIIVKKGEIIDPINAKIILEIPEIEKVKVRSPLTCEAVEGICTRCYGYNLGTQNLVEQGVAVGIIAGQAMGEASTQLTMSSKHTAAKLGTADITQGLPRIEELYECRTPKSKAFIAEIDGTVKIVEVEKKGKKVKVLRIENVEEINKTYVLKEGDKIEFSRNKKIKKGEPLVTMKDGSILVAPIEGQVTRSDDSISFSGERHIEAEFEIHQDTILRVEENQKVIAGQQISEGSLDPKDLMKFGDIHRAEQYLIDNIQEVYGIQGIAIDDKHMEVIVRMMGSFVKIVDAGDSLFIPGDLVSYQQVRVENLKLRDAGKRPAKYIRQLLGITNAAIKTDSFLSAASFQEQIRVLSETAIKGGIDYLKGLKENVIIGKQVPLGSNNKEI